MACNWQQERYSSQAKRFRALGGVPCYQGSCFEVYLEKAFDGKCRRLGYRLPVARELGETSIMFLVHPTLAQAEVDKTYEVIQRVMAVASK